MTSKKVQETEEYWFAKFFMDWDVRSAIYYAYWLGAAHASLNRLDYNHTNLLEAVVSAVQSMFLTDSPREREK